MGQDISAQWRDILTTIWAKCFGKSKRWRWLLCPLNGRICFWMINTFETQLYMPNIFVVLVERVAKTYIQAWGALVNFSPLTLGFLPNIYQAAAAQTPGSKVPGMARNALASYVQLPQSYVLTFPATTCLFQLRKQKAANLFEHLTLVSSEPHCRHTALWASHSRRFHEWEKQKPQQQLGSWTRSATSILVKRMKWTKL